MASNFLRIPSGRFTCFLAAALTYFSYIVFLSPPAFTAFRNSRVSISCCFLAAAMIHGPMSLSLRQATHLSRVSAFFRLIGICLSYRGKQQKRAETANQSSHSKTFIRTLCRIIAAQSGHSRRVKLEPCPDAFLAQNVFRSFDRPVLRELLDGRQLDRVHDRRRRLNTDRELCGRWMTLNPVVLSELGNGERNGFEESLGVQLELMAHAKNIDVPDPAACHEASLSLSSVILPSHWLGRGVVGNFA